MAKERVVIYIQDDCSDDELMRMTEEAVAWVNKSDKKDAFVVTIAERVNDDVRIWDRSGLCTILGWIKYGQIDSIFVMDESMISKNIDERLLFYHLAQIFGCKVRIKERDAIQVDTISKYLDEIENNMPHQWFRRILMLKRRTDTSSLN